MKTQTLNHTIECADAWMKVEGLPTYSELFAALDELVIRCGDSDGVRADGSNIQTYAASAILAKYHSAYQAAFESEQQAA